MPPERRQTPAAALLLCTLLSCEAPAPQGPATAPAPAPATTPARQPPSGDPGVAVETLLRFDTDESGTYGLLVVRSGEFVTTLDQLREQLPDLPARARQDPRYIHQLAPAVMTCAGRPYGHIARMADIEENLTRHLDPLDVLQRRSWTAATSVSAPSPTDIGPPRWDGDVLVVDWVDSIGGSLDAFQGLRHRFTFTADAWKHEFAQIPAVLHAPVRARKAVVDAFAGEVRGFFRVPFDGAGALLVALGPASGVPRYHWRPTSGAPQRFATWADLSRAVAAVATPAALAAFTDHLHDALVEHRIRSEHYEVIADPAAYREEYRKNGYGTHILRYHGDKLKTTRFTVHDFDELAPPTIVDERLVAYFSDGSRQPVRLELDLSTLDWDSALPMVKRYDGRVESDTGNLFGGPNPLGPSTP